MLESWKNDMRLKPSLDTSSSLRLATGRSCFPALEGLAEGGGRKVRSMENRQLRSDLKAEYPRVLRLTINSPVPGVLQAEKLYAVHCLFEKFTRSF